MKTYIGISRDHSGSMRSLAHMAARDYNALIESIRSESSKHKQESNISVVKCGVGGTGIVERDLTFAGINYVGRMEENQYRADGGSTPLFDSVGELIDILEQAPDAFNPEVAFLVTVITDGQENSSRKWNARTITERMKKLQSTDRWSFTFRVPRGYAGTLLQMGIPRGNILEWDVTEAGFVAATAATQEAFTTYYTARTRGVTSTASFFKPDLVGVSAKTMESKLVDISSEVQVFKGETQEQIRPFVERKTGKTYKPGSAFYQLMKKEDEVQDYKMICIRNRQNGAVYSGAEARNLLGLPHTGTIKVAPGLHGNYDIFIQSTSVNRKVLPGMLILVWERAAK